MTLEVFMPLNMKFMNLNQDTIFIQVHAVDLNLDRFKNRFEYWTKFQELSFWSLYICVLCH